MGRFTRDEIEGAFRRYWQAGAVGEDWDAWADVFTEDCDYVEHVYGTMRGREAVRAWIKPIMERFGELYTVYEWHVVDEERGRVIVSMQNRRDHPSGQGVIDFPGITILDYAGGGKWSREEDYWSARGREAAMKEYEEACARHGDASRLAKTRRDWGSGPAWTRGAASWGERPRKG